jgi:hypothetical protein
MAGKPGKPVPLQDGGVYQSGKIVATAKVLVGD